MSLAVKIQSNFISCVQTDLVRIPVYWHLLKCYTLSTRRHFLLWLKFYSDNSQRPVWKHRQGITVANIIIRLKCIADLNLVRVLALGVATWNVASVFFANIDSV